MCVSISDKKVTQTPCCVSKLHATVKCNWGINYRFAYSLLQCVLGTVAMSTTAT